MTKDDRDQMGGMGGMSAKQARKDKKSKKKQDKVPQQVAGRQIKRTDCRLCCVLQADFPSMAPPAGWGNTQQSLQGNTQQPAHGRAAQVAARAKAREPVCIQPEVHC